MRIALPVNGEDLDPRWGKAHDVVVAEVNAGEISSWELYEVEWDRLHDEGPMERITPGSSASSLPTRSTRS